MNVKHCSSWESCFQDADKICLEDKIWIGFSGWSSVDRVHLAIAVHAVHGQMGAHRRSMASGFNALNFNGLKLQICNLNFK